MKTYLCRWPNGTLSIVTAENDNELRQELMKEGVCLENDEWDSPDGLIIEMPKGFRLHFYFNDEADLMFFGFPQDAMPTVERLYPHLAAAFKVPYKTKRAALAAAKEAVEKERQGLK
jgi:hypothetical protein